MADIRITIEGARGVGKTTFVKYLFNLLANTTYFVDEVQDTDVLSTGWIQNIVSVLTPRRRRPRTISIRVLERGFSEVFVDEDIEDDLEL
jgi:nucleoside-triphosphatase THEP1